MARNPNFALKSRIVEKYGSQSDFSPEIGIPENRLSRLVNGRDVPKPDQARRIAEKLDCAVEDIFPA